MSSESSQTRIRILKATWDLLEENTGKEVRMSDIAKRASISRQAVYLHFPTRADLLVATTRYMDEVLGTDAKLAASRSAKTGLERLDAYIEAWGNYIPQIYSVAKAILALKDTDEAANAAWADRMAAHKHGCAAAVDALHRDQMLAGGMTPEMATDMLWTLLSVRTWEQITQDCGWSQSQYITITKDVARRVLAGNAAPEGTMLN